MLYARDMQMPSHKLRKQHIIDTFARYWPSNEQYVTDLPIVITNKFEPVIPLKLQEIILPEWGAQYGVDGKMLVPHELIMAEDGANWAAIDWWTAAFVLLEAWHERSYEKRTERSIHSYSFRLKGWDDRVWEYAWVNRIALFIRAWAAKSRNETEERVFGLLPKAEIIMTHDVDAINHTGAIRLKQTVFNSFNFLRLLLRGRIQLAFGALKQTMTFLTMKEDWWKLEETMHIEKNAGLLSWFNFYAGDNKKSLKKWLFDPGYKMDDRRLERFINEANLSGFKIGLHPSYDSWNDKDYMASQLAKLRNQTSINVDQCRQHWLRFSWFCTWRIQTDAGIRLDTTMMFNDRAGFRCAAAIRFYPWDTELNKEHAVEELPTVLMDSHLYDYKQMSRVERTKEIDKWITEIQAVCGSAAVLWHPHTLTNTYGWKEGFVTLVERIKNK